jgi:phosphoglycerate dehydrogenase-like enzyme
MGKRRSFDDRHPLLAGHRLWTHPKAIVTPHIADGSPRLIDKQKGY